MTPSPVTLTATPYLSFPGNAAEVLGHWQQLFGGELEVRTYGAEPMEGLPFDPPADAVAHAVLTAPGLTICGGDGIGEDLPGLESGVYSFLLTVGSAEEGRAVYARVVEAGGTAEMPFEVAPWGDHYGQVRDRYGVRWAVTTGS